MATTHRRQFIVPGAIGLHLRPAALLAGIAQRFTAEIRIRHKGADASAKSPLEILSLGAGYGSRVTVTIAGDDADAATAAISRLFALGFDDASSAGGSSPRSDLAVGSPCMEAQI